MIHPTDVVCFKRKEYHQFLHIHLASLRPDFPCFVESVAGNQDYVAISDSANS
jgi:hypothetical protein